MLTNISLCTYIQYMRCIRPLEVGNRNYIFLYDFERYKMHPMRKGYVCTTEDNLFYCWKERSHIFRSRSSLSWRYIQLRHRKSKDFLAFLEDKSKQPCDTRPYILPYFHTKCLNMDLYILCLYTVCRKGNHHQWCIRLQIFKYLMMIWGFFIRFKELMIY